MKATSETEITKAATAMGRRSVEARIKKWGKDGLTKRMQEWGKLGGRPPGSKAKKATKKGTK